MYIKTIYLIRHGTTEWMEQGLTHGALNSPLSAFGEWEAQQAAEALKDCGITHIFSSPQGRAMQTAGFIAKKIPNAKFTQLDGLREMGFGFREGKKNFYSKKATSPFLFYITIPFFHIIMQLTGEKGKDMRKRVMDAWQFILAQDEPGNFAVVSHSAVLNMLAHTLSASNNDVKKRKRNIVGTCSISKVKIDEQGQPILTQFNSVSHLNKNKDNYGH
ncbi:MAG: histidine phosphatase family protein [Chloroflexi bacterium]|nr:histidine phosphatase family protein [Chloroflexota bacterium]